MIVGLLLLKLFHSVTDLTIRITTLSSIDTWSNLQQMYTSETDKECQTKCTGTVEVDRRVF